LPKCCPVTSKNPKGICIKNEDVCCTNDQGGGFCPAATPACCTPQPGSTKRTCCLTAEDCCGPDKPCDGGNVCTNGCCAPPSGASAAAERQFPEETKE
jgi:hypothetical protein